MPSDADGGVALAPAPAPAQLPEWPSPAPPGGPDRLPRSAAASTRSAASPSITAAGSSSGKDSQEELRGQDEVMEQSLRNIVAGFRHLANVVEEALPSGEVLQGKPRNSLFPEAGEGGGSLDSTLVDRFRGPPGSEPVQDAERKKQPWTDVQRQEIGISVNVKAIWDIKNTEESAKALVEVCLIGLKSVNVGEILKALVFARAIEQIQVDDIWRLRSNHLKGGLQAWVASWALALHLDMNFGNYPFDVQDLVLRPCAWTNGIRLVEPGKFWSWSKDAKGNNRQELTYSRVLLVPRLALVSEEWKLAPPLWDIGPADGTVKYGVGEQMNVHLKLQRKGWGFIERFSCSLGFISLTAFLPLLSPQVNVSDSLSFEVVVLFTMIAYQNVVSSYVPVTSTHTILDEYTWMLFLFVLLLMLSVVVFSMRNPEQAHLEDWLLLAEGNVVVWVLTHAWLGYRIVRAICQRRKALDIKQQTEAVPLAIIPREKMVEERAQFDSSTFDEDDRQEREPLLR